MTTPRGEVVAAGGVKYVYGGSRAVSTAALNGITLSIGKGEFVAVVGRNGSGKSTFARLLNALLLPTGGVVRINGIDTRDEDRVWEVRRSCGMVFQDPDSQIVGTTVEEDVAFGPENLGLPPHLIRNRVQEALETVGMIHSAAIAPRFLSGGEKQRVCLAGILAMKPQCIILDEVTALLDPGGRKEVMALVRRLHKEEGLTVVYITHHMEEAVLADRIIVLDEGTIALDGNPQEIFADAEQVRRFGLALPQVTELFDLLNLDGLHLPKGVVDPEEALAAVMSCQRDCHVYPD